jgi:hypothetical protein
MSITLIQDIPTGNIAAYDDLFVRVSSDRYEVTKATAGITAYSQSAGDRRVKITIPIGLSFATGDSVLVYDATGARTIYNGRHDIDSIPTAGILKTETAWPGTAVSGGFGELKRMNDNFTMRVDVNDSDGLIGSMYSYPVIIGSTAQFVFNIAPIIQDFSTNFEATAGLITMSGSLKDFNADVTEVYQNASYDSIDGDATSLYGGATVTAYRSVNIDDSLFSGAAATGIKMIHGYDTLTIREDVLLPISWFQTSIGTASATGMFPATGLSKGAYTYMIDVSSMTGENEISLVVGDSVAETKYVVIDNKCYPYAKTFYFLNRFGGYDPYDFLYCEEEQEAEKVEIRRTTLTGVGTKSDYVTRTYRRLRCEGRTAKRNEGQYLRDLVSSPEVWDEDGVRVRVTNQTLRFRGEDVTPEITVEYNDETCINFQ